MHPFGLGYMGYSFIYPQMQTADYSVKFVHNDILQQGLDTGIIPMLILVYLIISNIFEKNTNMRKREILLLLAIHMLFDFDMQFLVICFIFVAMLADTNGKDVVIKIEKAKIATLLLVTVFIAVWAYYAVASVAEKLGNYSLAQELLSNKTSSNMQILRNTENVEQANTLADKILLQNKYVAIAYKAKANYFYNKQNWEEMIENLKQAISLNKYNIKEYEDFILIISHALEQTVTQEDDESTKYLIKEAQSVEGMLEQVKQNTNKLAYETVDKPELELNDSTKQYLNILENY